MSFIFSISLCIQHLTVEGSTAFGQCSGRKCSVNVFNWNSGSTVRARRGMSPIHFPAVAIVPEGGKQWWRITNNYYDKMILDTGKSESRFYFPRKYRPHVDVVRVGLGGGDLVEVSAVDDYNQPERAGFIGVGPYSSVMNQVEKLELTIRRGRYTKLRSGANVNESGYVFENTVRIDGYPEAWAVEGFLAYNSTYFQGHMPVRIVFLTFAIPESLIYPTFFKVDIAQTSFSLRGDEFFFGRQDALVVNPIVLGSRDDIRILFDASGETKRVGLKLLGPRKA